MKSLSFISILAVVLLVCNTVNASTYTYCTENSMMPKWAIPHGGEYWRVNNGRESIDVMNAIERVSCAFREGDNGRPKVKTPTYTVCMRSEGPEFSVAHNSLKSIVRTQAVKQDKQVVYDAGSAPDAWWVIGNTAQRFLDEQHNLVEHIEAREDGIYITWHFVDAVTESKPLTVYVQLDNVSYAGKNSSGCHYADTQGIVRVCVGPACVVDATGARFPVDSEADEQQLVVTVSPEVLSSVVYPFCIDPAISPEFGMDNHIVYAPAEFEQKYPKVAFGATNYLVVWEDLRDSYWADEKPDIFGARLSPSGELLDPIGIRISSVVKHQQRPAIAWNGTNFLTVWHDLRDGENYLIYGCRVSDGGAVLDPDAFVIGNPTNVGFQMCADVASDGADFLVVWEDRSQYEYDIYGRCVSGDGQPLGISDFVICRVTNRQEDVAVAWGGTNYLVTWSDMRHTPELWYYTDIYGTRVSAVGEVLETNGIPISTYYGRSEREPDVSWGVSNFFVVWEDTRDYSETNRTDIYGGRVAPSGVPLDPGGIPICQYASNQTYASICKGATNFLVAWSDARFSNLKMNIYAARISYEGLVMDSPAFPVYANLTNDSKNPCVAFDGSDYLITWDTEDDELNTVHIYASRVSQQNEILTPSNMLVSQSANYQWDSAVAWGNTNYLVVWEDDADEIDSDLYGVRVGSSGDILDPDGLAICTVTNDQENPSVIWGGTNFFVVWEDARNERTNNLLYEDVYGARITESGIILDPDGIGVTTNMGPELSPEVSWNNSDSFMVTWYEYRNSIPPDHIVSDIYAARVDEGGQVLDPIGFPICTITNHQTYPDIAWGNTNYLVVWEDRRNGTNDMIYGARVTGDGTVLDPLGIDISVFVTNQTYPSVAWGGTNYLVVWEDKRNDYNDDDIYGTRISPSGMNLDAGALEICTTTNGQEYPDVEWGGTNFIVVWQNNEAERVDLFGQRVDNAGNLLDGADGFALFEDRQRRLYPALASRSNGLFLVTYSRTRWEPFNSMRIMGAFLDISPASLEIISLYGDGVPSIGTNYFVRGLPVSAVLTSSPAQYGTTQYVCRGWAGSGSTPLSGTTTNTGEFIIDNDSTVTWLWETNYYLWTDISGVGSLDFTNGWFTNGTLVTLTATEGAHYYFHGWQRDVPIGNTNDNPLTMTMDHARLVMPFFAPYLTPDGTPHWWLADYGLPTNQAAADLDQDGDTLFSREEYIALTDPTNRNSYFCMYQDCGSPGHVMLVNISQTWTDRVYDVLWKTNLTDSSLSWTSMHRNVSGTGTNLIIGITNNIPGAIYRFGVTLK